MQAPKRKTSKSKRDMRRSHHALVPQRSSSCPNCGEPVTPYHACAACGQYRGRQQISAAESE